MALRVLCFGVVGLLTVQSWCLAAETRVCEREFHCRVVRLMHGVMPATLMYATKSKQQWRAAAGLLAVCERDTMDSVQSQTYRGSTAMDQTYALV